MNAKFLLVGTVAAGITLYAWQTLSNVALPWHEATLREFTDNDAAVRAIRAGAPENGVYFAPQGVLAAVSFTPDMADKTQAMGGMLGRQVVIDLVTAFLLCLLVLRLPAITPLGTGSTLGLAGLAAGVVVQLSDWNWYGFAAGYSVVNAIDLAIAWFLAGLVLGAILKRRRRAAIAPLTTGHSAVT